MLQITLNRKENNRSLSRCPEQSLDTGQLGTIIPAMGYEERLPDNVSKILASRDRLGSVYTCHKYQADDGKVWEFQLGGAEDPGPDRNHPQTEYIWVRGRVEVRVVKGTKRGRSGGMVGVVEVREGVCNYSTRLRFEFDGDACEIWDMIKDGSLMSVDEAVGYIESVASLRP